MTMEFPRSAARASRLHVVARTGSTNADLRAHARDTASWPHLSVLVTRDQTAGRGRLDRVWTAPAGAALAISVMLRPRMDHALRGWIPLIAGVAMADALSEQVAARDVAVKWPNDVLVDGLKICGILAEASDDAVIVGAGVNTAMTVEQLPVPTATSFAVLGAVADEDRLLADYLDRLDALLGMLSASGDPMAGGVHAAAVARSASIGREVEVTLPGGRMLVGTAVALDDEGRLVVSTDGRREAVSAGDVVHARRA